MKLSVALGWDHIPHILVSWLLNRRISRKRKKCCLSPFLSIRRLLGKRAFFLCTSVFITDVCALVNFLQCFDDLIFKCYREKSSTSLSLPLTDLPVKLFYVSIVSFPSTALILSPQTLWNRSFLIQFFFFTSYVGRRRSCIYTLSHLHCVERFLWYTQRPVMLITLYFCVAFLSHICSWPHTTRLQRWMHYKTDTEMEAGGLRKQMLNGTVDRFDIPTIPYPSAHTFIICTFPAV